MNISGILREKKIEFSDFKLEVINSKYCASSFKVKGKIYKYRKGNLTPRKVGLFVAFYKVDNINVPYEDIDEFDYLVIDCNVEEYYGYFILSKTDLIKLGVIKSVKDNSEGKMGFRVYPDSKKVIVLNKQASKTKRLYDGSYMSDIDI
jgi:hypothetical protein